MPQTARLLGPALIKYYLHYLINEDVFGPCRMHENGENAHEGVIRKPEEKPRWEPSRRREDNIKTNLKFMEQQYWIDLVYDRQADINTIKNHRFPLDVGNFQLEA